MSFPPTPFSPKLNVVTLSGASALNEEQVGALVKEACDEFKRLHEAGQPFLSTVIHPGPNTDMVVALVPLNDDYHVLFLGLGLEVIQTMQNFEKTHG